MSSPGPSSGTPNPTDPFDELWRRLRENHRGALQELEEKVSKLKKERYLDAQSLEVFHFRTQQLKEQNKTLQDAVTRLEIRLGTGDCDRCAILQENLKSNQDQNLRLIAKLTNETESLEDENRKLNAELLKIKISRLEAQQPSSSDHEEGVIPDSPILPSSLPVANKLRKRKDLNKMKHVRYAEIPRANKSLFSVLVKEPVDAAKDPGRSQVLVPNTCELDTSQISNDLNLNLEEAVAETCGLELLDKPHMKPETTAGQQSRKLGFGLKPHRSSLLCSMFRSPEKTTGKSPSLLQSVKRFSQDGANNKAKRIKEESEPEAREEDKQGIQEGKDQPKEGKQIQPELIKGSSTPLSHQSLKKCRVGSKDPLSEDVTCSLEPDGSSPSPAFKKPHVQEKATRDSVGRRRSPQQDLNASHDQSKGREGRRVKVEPSWSIDPALALSMYDMDEEDEEECPSELLDSDRTWVSHSLLQCRGENAQRDNSVSGLGEKANDSLDMMFDTTAHGEYKSYNNSHLGQSQLRGGGDQGEDDDEDDDEDDGDDDPHENTMSEGFGHKAGRPTFAHMAVIRKKDERLKLKGTTCKECEIYYAHLPEDAKQKKLSACSRHRYLYVPPCTPENFWEVGFPSTQTCIDRGYVREEKTPQARTRRRQPYNALFSPKQKQQQS